MRAALGFILWVINRIRYDWWHRIEGQALYPRYELIDEFRRESGGCSLHIIPFSSFLDLYGASESVVEEVREEESRLSVEFSLIGELIHKWQILEQVLLSKYRAANPNLSDRWISPNRIAQGLYQQQLIDSSIADYIQELNRLRNVLVHERSANSLTDPEMRNMIIRVDELIEIIGQLPPNDAG
jgi:uncharacterized protein YutE (UPF0331/DUF86 family)